MSTSQFSKSIHHMKLVSVDQFYKFVFSLCHAIELIYQAKQKIAFAYNGYKTKTRLQRLRMNFIVHCAYSHTYVEG